MLEFLKKGWWTILLAGVVGWCAKSLSVRTARETMVSSPVSFETKLIFVAVVLLFCVCIAILIFQMTQKQESANEKWTCDCGKKHKSAEKYCSLCGDKKPIAPVPVPKPTINPVSNSEWTCDCGEKNSTEDKFCGNCGKQNPSTIDWICTGCGAKNSGNKKFCTKCGKNK